MHNTEERKDRRIAAVDNVSESEQTKQVNMNDGVPEPA
jgi:hypothetical protein